MAAGLGFKTFTTGEVLTAADVNGYLMQGVLVFASAAARNAAITSPQEGQFAFTKDTNGLWYYDGAAWVASGATGDIEGVTAGVGITGGGTSGTVTITNDMATTITAAGDIVVGTGSGTYDNLPIGTTAQVLTADTTVSPYKVKWATPAASASPLTTKGDVYTYTTTDARLAVGADNTFLRANSATATGLEYANAYTSYTPSLTGITIGNGTLTGKYMRVGKMCQGEVIIVFGSTTSVTGIPEIGLPFTSTTSANNPIQCTLLDNGTAVMPGLAYLQSSTTIRIVCINTAGTYATEAGISSTVPFTWATADRINVNFCFEVA